MDLAYAVQRSSNRKTLTITVERDRRVVVHAPSDVSDETIELAVESRRQWIFGKLRHGKKYQELPHPPGKEMITGESALYLGRSYRLEVIPNGADEIQFTQRFLIPSALAGRRKGRMREWYLARARQIILPRVNRHAVLLGVEFRQASIVDNRYRWGSCTIGSKVTLNWRLIKSPDVRHRLRHRA